MTFTKTAAESPDVREEKNKGAKAADTDDSDKTKAKWPTSTREEDIDGNSVVPALGTMKIMTQEKSG